MTTHEQRSLPKSPISRRKFLLSCAGAIAGLAGSTTASFGTQGLAISAMSGSPPAIGASGRKPIAPLFCTAYITPDAPGQGGQEAAVARYPLAIVPQDNSASYRTWRNKVKSLNPDIILLGYQVVIQRPEATGPGNDILRKSENYCVYPWGTTPTVPGEYPGAKAKIYDPRSPQWQNAFLSACRTTLASYPYDGLFLDQCTVFVKAYPFPQVRQEMRAALQATLTALRMEFPNVILVGNSSYSWDGLNGEMDEGRPDDMAMEFAPFPGHASPRIEMYQSILKRSDDIAKVEREMTLAHSYGAFYGAAVNSQHVLWFDIFDSVIASYR
ncbi:MAG: hypothetical protein ACYDDO_04545 [Acidiferrobacterales bacterium]